MGKVRDRLETALQELCAAKDTAKRNYEAAREAPPIICEPTAKGRARAELNQQETAQRWWYYYQTALIEVVRLERFIASGKAEDYDSPEDTDE